MRERNIAYLDTAGNIFLAMDEIYLWIDGRTVPAETKPPVTNRAFTKTGLKVVFHILLHKDAINQPYREIAAATGVALGNINNLLEGLRDAGFILKMDKRKMTLINKKELLARWIAGYQETLKPALHTGDFFLKPHEQPDNWKKHPIDVPDTVWGGEPAAEALTKYLKPARLTIYTTQPKNTLASHLKLIPGKGPVAMYQKFWKDEEPTLYARHYSFMQT